VDGRAAWGTIDKTGPPYGEPVFYIIGIETMFGRCNPQKDRQAEKREEVF
jgi:hypothetical protein